MVLVVLDRDLEMLAWVPDLSEQRLEQIIGESNDVLAAALTGEQEPERISYISHDQSLTLAVPVIGEQGKHLGILMLRMAMNFTRVLILSIRQMRDAMESLSLRIWNRAVTTG